MNGKIYDFYRFFTDIRFTDLNNEFFIQYSNKKLKMESNDNFDRYRILHLFAFYIESLSLYTQSIERQYNYIIRRFIENLQLADLFDTISDRLAEYPPLKFVLLASVLTCTVPVVLFIAFGIVSVIVTFIGFLFIEGTLLAVGGLCMFICILTMILALTVLGMILGMSYMLTLKLAQRINSFDTPSRFLRALVPSVSEREIVVSANMIAETHQD